MIDAEPQKGRRGKMQYVGSGAGPNRGGHRKQIVMSKRFAITARIEKLPHATSRSRRIREMRPCRSVEAGDVSQHTEERRRKSIAPLREKRVQVRSGPFEPAAVERDR